MDDVELLSRMPERVSLGGLLKATPATEGDDRILYLEASNEDVDIQNEVVLQKALAESADYYMRHGNVDISHYTILGPASGLTNFLDYEIGKPIDVNVNGSRTFVKAMLYRGESPMAKNADMVWKSMTDQSPPSRWYPSIGGAVLSKSIKIDPKTKGRVAVIDRVRWNNIALDRCPVNKTVPTASTMPMGTFAKALGGFVLKGLEAGYGSDSAALAGGGALREQSLEGAPLNYWSFRDSISNDMVEKRIKNPGAEALVSHAMQTYNLTRGTAAEWVERLMADIKRNLKRKV